MPHPSPAARALGAAGLLAVLLLCLLAGCAGAPPSFQAVWRADRVDAAAGRRVLVVRSEAGGTERSIEVAP